jgi:hypothetical protein
VIILYLVLQGQIAILMEGKIGNLASFLDPLALIQAEIQAVSISI